MRTFFLLVLVTELGFSATTYNVGPHQPYPTLGAVPWYTLAAGDTVNIYYKPGCYAEKFLISTQGTSWNNPITVQGINDPATGTQPCVTGLNAVQGATSHDRWSGSGSAQYSESLYVIGISLQAGASYGPAYVVVDNLEVTGAVAGGLYTADDGTSQPYLSGVAGVRIVNADHVKIQNCYVHGIGGNGVFGKPNEWFPGTMADIQLLYNHLGQNGIAGNYSVHNSYIEADQSVYMGNLYEPLVTGAAGSDLKDRSAGTVVEYNRFSGSAARFIDLVEPQDGWPIFGSRAYYGYDFVFGNIFFTNASDANFQQAGIPIHYGGDQGATAYYRNQTLSFYDNTLVYIANTTDGWKTAMFQPELATGTVDIRNNIFLFLPRTNGGGTPEIDWSGNNNGAPTGTFQFGANWISPGWHMAFTGWTPFAGTSFGAQNLFSPANNVSPLNNPSAGDFTLVSGSTAINLAGTLGLLVTSNPQQGNYTPTLQYTVDQQTTSRPNLNDVGALAATTAGSAIIQQGLAGYSGGSGTAISNLYYGYTWNHGVGHTFPDNGVLYMQNTSANGGFEIRPLIGFSNLGFVKAATVLSAQLTLTITSWVTQGPIVGYYLVPKWDNSVNWTMSTASAKWAIPGASNSGGDVVAGKSFTIPQLTNGGLQTVTVNLDSLIVQGWISNPSSANGVILFNTGQGSAAISSNTAASQAVRPKLTITY